MAGGINGRIPFVENPGQKVWTEMYSKYKEAEDCADLEPGNGPLSEAKI